MKICIGIISYIPDSNRSGREGAIQKLVTQINKIFPGLPIMFITQNWGTFQVQSDNEIIRYDYSAPLGITPARITLRQKFLESEYDYLIMLDDDSDLRGDGADYLKEIKLHPDGFGWFSNHLLKLFAISKYVYANVEMPNINAEKIEGFEDKIFISMCRIKYPDREFEFDRSKLDEVSYCSPEGPHSTWWNSTTAARIKDLTAKTDQFIRAYAKQLGVEFDVPVGKLPDDNLQRKKKQPVDIVITYVNNQDPEWQALFQEYKQKERPKETDQTASPQRYRDPGTLPYLLRGIEANCPWVHKVFLVVQSESQIPEWLNRDYSKLRIVYHQEFIPEELLPTFNTNVIHMNLCNIKDLADNYILCNDDMFFMNKLEREDFFIGNIPCQYIQKAGYPRSSDDFFAMIKHNYDLIDEILGCSGNYFKHTHIQSARNKYIEKYLLEKYKDRIYDSFRQSHFRSRDNYTDWFYDDYLKAAGLCHHKADLSAIGHQYALKTITVYSDHYKLLCINDDASVDDWGKAVEGMLFFLSSKFPTRCAFEKGYVEEGIKGRRVTPSSPSSPSFFC